MRMVAAQPSAVELCEQLEQLRALHLGMQIRVGLPEEPLVKGVDTEDDLRAAEEWLRRGRWTN